MNPLASLSARPRFYRWILRMHPAVERSERIVRTLTHQRFGVMDLVGLDAVRITVPGRRSGILRTSTVYSIVDGDRILAVGSNWGLPEHPSWSANLKAASHAYVRVRRDEFTATVRLLSDSERAEAWSAILDRWPNYRLAQDLVPQREFRIFELRAVNVRTN